MRGSRLDFRKIGQLDFPIPSIFLVLRMRFEADDGDVLMVRPVYSVHTGGTAVAVFEI